MTKEYRLKTANSDVEKEEKLQLQDIKGESFSKLPQTLFKVEAAAPLVSCKVNNRTIFLKLWMTYTLKSTKAPFYQIEN